MQTQLAVVVVAAMPRRPRAGRSRRHVRRKVDRGVEVVAWEWGSNDSRSICCTTAAVVCDAAYRPLKARAALTSCMGSRLAI